jgi:hypothetical protein
VLHCSIQETQFRKWGWCGPPHPIKAIVFGLSDGKLKSFVGIQKAREFQREVTSLLVSTSSRGTPAAATGAVIVHPSWPNHLAVHNVVDDDDVVVLSAATSATTSRKQDISDNV